jgi:N-acyl-D-amino-acid deacylase
MGRQLVIGRDTSSGGGSFAATETENGRNMARYDTIIRNGTIIDGRNIPRFVGDIGISNGKIARIGRLGEADAAQVIDATGLIVAPGFVDLHTHYDPQLFWDPYCTISGWHGVTSVAIGNCGFGFAPARESDREYLMKSLSRVEAIPATCIEMALPWTWETFPEWLDALDRQPKGVNVLSYVPLNPLIVYVLGLADAKQRDATPEEEAEIARLLREALDAGACGWSAQVTRPGSGADCQRDYDGSPFATDLLSDETALSLAKVLADYDHTVIQMIYVTEGDVAESRRHVEEISAVSGSPVIFNAVATPDGDGHPYFRDALAWIRSCRDRGLPIYAQLITSGAAFTFTFEDWNMFDESDAWREATLGTPAERLEKFRDPARRQALRDDVPFLFPIDGVVILRTYSEKFQAAKGLLLGDACRILGYDNKVDLLIDIVVADELRTLLQVPQFNTNPDMQAELVTEPYGLWGTSDGGAHTKFITLGAYPTESIISFVRERNLLPLEEAHWRLSALNAMAGGVRDRGTLVEGAAADIIVYDYENLRLLDEEVVEDLPGGEWRRIRRAEGYRYVMVNGTVTFVDGEETGATPGALLRHGTAAQ